MHKLESIKKIVTETLRAQFNRIKILDVQVHEDVDLDGDEVLRIDVVFEGHLDPRKLSGVIRYLRPKLDEVHESAFPLLSFISSAEAHTRGKRASV
jgi:hypothetical protein